MSRPMSYDQVSRMIVAHGGDRPAPSVVDGSVLATVRLPDGGTRVERVAMDRDAVLTFLGY